MAMEPILVRLQKDFATKDGEKFVIYRGTKGDRRMYSVKVNLIWGKKDLLKETYPQIPISIQKRKDHKVVWTKKDFICVVPRTWEDWGQMGNYLKMEKETGKFLQWFMRACELV